jgi:hypothetical protein
MELLDELARRHVVACDLKSIAVRWDGQEGDLREICDQGYAWWQGGVVRARSGRLWPSPGL